MDKAKGKENVMIKKEGPGTDSPEDFTVKDSSSTKETEETEQTEKTEN